MLLPLYFPGVTGKVDITSFGIACVWSVNVTLQIYNLFSRPLISVCGETGLYGRVVR